VSGNKYLREFYSTLALKFVCMNNTDLSSFAPSLFPFPFSRDNTVIL